MSKTFGSKDFSIFLNQFKKKIEVGSISNAPRIESLIIEHILIIEHFPILFSFLNQIEQLLCHWTCKLEGY